MGKKIKKAVRKLTKPVEKVVKGTVGVLAGGVQTPDMPEVPTPAAAPVETPEVKAEGDEGEAQTESSRKKARAGGKKSLSVARSSGGGLNI